MLLSWLERSLLYALSITHSMQVNFAPDFVSGPDRTATVAIVADHVEHIAKVAGKRQYVNL